ncbi:PAS domain-containing protein [Hydrogenophaga sp.]|uniref:PAS domain-containing protein n=1 Tax=Hydrogenophaga sp. TaxID=1904254 RepID=UPI0025C249DA|nr:PAS domain-containing protein [Hydrogenophaga sp.]MBT9463932.1 PAS domain-containing protein [Hydrogenophaga sp.]
MSDPVPALLLGWLNAYPSVIMIADEAGRVVFANDAACQWRGCDRQQLLQASVHDIDAALWREWSDAAHPRWRPGASTQWQSWHEAADGRRVATNFRLQGLTLREQRFLVLSSGELNPRGDVEQELKRTLAFVQGIVDAFPDFLFEGSAEGRYLNTWTKNPELLASSRDFMLGRTLDEVLSPASAAIAKAAFREADERGLSFGKVISVDTAQGRHWYELSVSKMPMGEGEAPHFITVSRDVSARLALQEALEEKERQFRTLVENSPDLIARFDASSCCLYANPALAERTHREPAELIGMTPGDCLGSTPGEELQHRMRACLRRGEPQHMELSWTDTKGRPACFLVSLTPEFDSLNRVGSVLLVGRDIGELRAHQDRIHRLVESNIIGVLFWHDDGRIEAANDAFLDMLGYSRSDLLTGHVRWNHLTPPGHEEADQRTAEEIRLTGACGAYEKELLHRDGRRVPVLVGSAMLDREQQLRVTYVLDQTERRRAEVERRAREAAEAASRAKGEFLAHMSHEIRTPLNAVLGMAYLAERETREISTREKLEKIARAGHSLLNLINDILDFSKIEAGLLKIEHAPFDLQKVLDNVAVIMGSVVSSKAVEVLVAPLPMGVQHLVGDAFRIEQVLINLAGNALKFTHEGHVELSVRVIDKVRDRVTLRFSVEDTGIGMTREEVASLFKPFTQAEVSTSRRFGGTGLGLSISKQLVELMHSEIVVESTKGRGSAFRFTVEVGLATDSEWPASEAFARRQVLLAMAHERTRDNLIQICHRLDWGVSNVAIGEAGAPAVVGRGVDPVADVVLIEWGSDDGAGPALARQLRDATAGRSLGLVAVTRAREALALESLVDQGVLDALLVKPVTPSTLRESVDRALRRCGRSPETDGKTRSESAPLRGIRVMVVDDNDTNRELASSILASHGASVITAADGQTSVDILQVDRSVCDIVLMDLQMPGMDGMQATSRIRQLPGCETLPIVALTASAFNEQREAALGAGMDAVVTKPFDVEGLVRLLFRLGRGLVESEGMAADSPPPGTSTVSSGELLLVDFNVGLQLWQDLGHYRHHLHRFVQEHEDEAQRADALGNEDLIRHVHKTRGSASALALMAAAQVASHLEEHLRTGVRDPDEIARFASEIGRTCVAIGEHLDTPRAK